MTDPKARELAREQKAREWMPVAIEVPIFREQAIKLLAAYGSSEYERGLRDMREKAATFCQENHEHFGTFLAASIRQIK